MLQFKQMKKKKRNRSELAPWVHIWDCSFSCGGESVFKSVLSFRMSSRLWQQLGCAMLHMWRCSSLGTLNHDHGSIDSRTLSAGWAYFLLSGHSAASWPCTSQSSLVSEPNCGRSAGVAMGTLSGAWANVQAVCRTLQPCSPINKMTAQNLGPTFTKSMTIFFFLFSTFISLQDAVPPRSVAGCRSSTFNCTG